MGDSVGGRLGTRPCIRSSTMHCVADFCVIPMGVEAGVSKWIAEAQRVVEKSGLKHEMHGYGTGIEGEWSEVMETIGKVHARLHEVRSGTKYSRFGAHIVSSAYPGAPRTFASAREWTRRGPWRTRSAASRRYSRPRTSEVNCFQILELLLRRRSDKAWAALMPASPARLILPLFRASEHTARGCSESSTKPSGYGPVPCG